MVRTHALRGHLRGCCSYCVDRPNRRLVWLKRRRNLTSHHHTEPNISACTYLPLRPQRHRQALKSCSHRYPLQGSFPSLTNFVHASNSVGLVCLATVFSLKDQATFGVCQSAFKAHPQLIVSLGVIPPSAWGRRHRRETDHSVHDLEAVNASTVHGGERSSCRGTFPCSSNQTGG